MKSKIIKWLTIIVLVLILATIAPNLIKNIKQTFKEIYFPTTKVGLVCIKGMISSTGKYAKHIKKVFEDKNVKGILLKIDSPGGHAGSSDALYHEIMQLKAENPKPIVVLTQDLCASAGYLLACTGDYIVASPSAIVGSIGAYIGNFNVKDLLNKVDVKYNIQKAGKYKTVLNPFTESTKEESELLQNVVENTYKHFIEEVAKARNLSLKDQNVWAEGKIFTGLQAKEIGLINETGSEYTAVKKLKELALIEGKIEFVKTPRPSLLDKITGEFDDEDDDDCTYTQAFENAVTNFLCKQFNTKM